MQIDVTRQGVQPNDNKDDSPVLQNIINNAKPNSVIFLPAGHYILSEPLYVKVKGITMQGEDSTVLQFDNSVDYYKKYGQRVGMLNIGADNITVDHLFFDQNFRNSGRKCEELPLIGGILLGCSYLGKAITTNNIIIKNCTIYDYYGDAISVFASRINNYSVNKNHLISAYIVGKWQTCAHKGEQGINVASGSNVTIADNKIEGSIDNAIATHANCQNITISNNTVTIMRGGLLISGITNGLVSNNSVELIKDAWTTISLAVAADLKKINNNSHVTVENNKIQIDKGVTVLAGIMLFGPGNDIIIKGNTIRSEDIQTAGAGIQLADRVNRPTKTNYFGDSIHIIDNEITNFKNAVKFNISDKVKQPEVELANNKISGHEKEVLKESTPFILRLPQNESEQ